MELHGLTAIITGSSQGLGFEIAKHFVLKGANVMLCARNKKELHEAQKKLLPLAINNQVLALPTDVAKPLQVSALIDATLSATHKIDVLVANAGIYGTKGAVEETDWEAWSETIDINLKGTVIQCRAVIPHFKKQCSGKIIILSGGGATKPMPYLSAYAASKAAVVRFAETLALELMNFHIDVNAIAPGALNTRLLDEILLAGPQKVGMDFYTQSLKQKEQGGTALDIAAKLCVFLASRESCGITGKLISAVWDPWKTLPQYINELKNSDIYTIRRIVPEDRGRQWGN